MATTADYLTQLQADKQALVNNLVEKGVEATNDETFTSLVPKVLDIQSGGAEVTKGLRIDSYDGDGYITEATLVGMTEIPNYYFFNAFNRTDTVLGKAKLNLPNNLTKIGNYGFGSCSNLPLTELADSITQIGNNAFQSCVNLALTKLPSSLTSIGNSAFSGCTQWVLAELPDGITSIGQNAFYNCQKVTFTDLPSSLTSVGTYAFEYCYDIPYLNLPTGYTYINVATFMYCRGVTRVVCNGAMTYISSQAFSSCENLVEFIMPNITRVPTLSNTNAFTNTPISKGTGYIYVPDDLVESFKTASNWSTYASQIKGISELA